MIKVRLLHLVPGVQCFGNWHCSEQIHHCHQFHHQSNGFCGKIAYFCTSLIQYLGTLSTKSLKRIVRKLLKKLCKILYKFFNLNFHNISKILIKDI